MRNFAFSQRGKDEERCWEEKNEILMKNKLIVNTINPWKLDDFLFYFIWTSARNVLHLTSFSQGSFERQNQSEETGERKNEEGHPRPSSNRALTCL